MSTRTPPANKPPASMSSGAQTPSHSTSRRDTLLGNPAYPGAKTKPPAGPPSVAQECPESGPWARCQRAAPRCAAGPCPVAPAAHPSRVAGPAGLFFERQLEELRLGRRLFRNLAVTRISYLLPAPGLLLPPWGSAKSIATVSCSCRKNWRNRRCRLRAAAVACATVGMSSFAGSDRGPRIIHMKSRIESNAKNKGHARAETCCCCCF